MTCRVLYLINVQKKKKKTCNIVDIWLAMTRVVWIRVMHIFRLVSEKAKQFAENAWKFEFDWSNLNFDQSGARFSNSSVEDCMH